MDVYVCMKLVFETKLQRYKHPHSSYQVVNPTINACNLPDHNHLL